jgi:Zn-dependent protease
MYFTVGFVLGAAKPVPVNYLNLRNPKRDMAFVALAGPASNIVLALGCALPLRFNLISMETAGGEFLLQVVILNLVLAIFNLIPIPPLDGSKVLASLLSDRLLPQFFALERYGFLLILLFLFLGLFQVILFPILNALLQIFVGISFF